MRRALATVFILVSFLCALVPTQVCAQTLTVEIEAEIEADVLAMPAQAMPTQAMPRQRPYAPPAVVVVRPLEDELPSQRRYATSSRIQEPPHTVVVLSGEPPPPVEDEPRIEGWGSFGPLVEGFDLSGADLVFDSPEIGALRGLSLSEWAGNEPLGQAVAGGIQLGVGMRAEGILRGPEVRLFIGGGDLDGEFNALEGAPDGLELATRSLFILRAELALGLQLELGPFIPYVQAIASFGGAFVDVEVRDARLGELGTETIVAPLFGAGLEVGADIEIEEGTTFGFAVRGNFLGTPSVGGVVRTSWGGE